MKKLRSILCGAALLSGSLAAMSDTYNAGGGYVTLLAHNSGNSGESTFVTNIVKSSVYGWSDERDPHSDTNYYCSYQLCTPKVDNSSYTWNGGRLVMAEKLRFLGKGQTLTINDLRLEGGATVVSLIKNDSPVLRGNVMVLATQASPAKFICDKGTMHYRVESAVIGGSLAHLQAKLDGEASLDSQYLELDNAVGYEGCLEVLDGLRLKLFSDMAGTVALASGSVLETSSGETVVGALDLSDGSVINLLAGGHISVTNNFVASGRISINIPEGVAEARALIDLPVGKGVLAADNFALNIPPRLGRLWIETANGVQTLYGEQLTFASYNGTTGFVVLEGSSPNKNQFDEASVWSDGRRPHEETNYYARSQVYCTTNSTFPGRSLTVGNEGFLRLNKNCRMTIHDLRVDSGTKNTSAYFTPSGSDGRLYLSGCMTVLSRLTDTWPFSFFGSNEDGQTWVSDQTIVGDANSALMARGHFNSTPGAVNNYVELLGDLTKFYGTLIVLTNETVRLGNSALPGTIRLDTPYSRVDTLAASNATIAVGAFITASGASISVASTNRLYVSSANITGSLEKAGDGTLGIASTTLGGASALRIAAGGLKPLLANAFGGIPLTFANGAGFVFDASPSDPDLASSGVNLTGSSLVMEGRLSIVFETNATIGAENITLPIATVTPLQADMFIAAALSPRIVSAGQSRRGRITSVTTGGGNIILFAEFRKRGIVISIH